MYYSNPVIYNKYFDIFDNSNGDHQQKLNAATAPGEDSENPIKTEYQDFPVFPLYSQLIQPVQQQLQTPQYQTLQQQFPQTYSSNQDFFFNNSTMFGATNINANPNANANVSVVVPPPATAAVAAPDLNPFHSLPVSYPTLNLQPPLLQQYRQESVPIQYGQYEYNKKLSSRLSTTSFDSSGSNNSSYSSKSTYESDSDEPTPQYYPGGKKRYRVIRGMSAGGCATRPPKNALSSNHFYIPVELELLNAGLEECCMPKWTNDENTDKRRIIRIERKQEGNKIIAKFSIVGCANDHPIAAPAPLETDVVEVSCLQCVVRSHEDEESQESGEDSPYASNSTSFSFNLVNGAPRDSSVEVDGLRYNYYITSVEVVEIVELLIGTQLRSPAERRKERGRVRSNLVPFWSKKPILSRMSDHNISNSSNSSPSDFRAELAKRIMGYDIRKPRGFDKEVRILRWDKLMPALKRALQSYYTEIPHSDSHLFST